MSKLYSNAVKVLRPSKAKMDAIRIQTQLENQQAKAHVDDLLLLSGKTVRELYDIYCDNRSSDESSLNKNCRVYLLGLLRKGVK